MAAVQTLLLELVMVALGHQDKVAQVVLGLVALTGLAVVAVAHLRPGQITRPQIQVARAEQELQAAYAAVASPMLVVVAAAAALLLVAQAVLAAAAQELLQAAALVGLERQIPAAAGVAHGITMVVLVVLALSSSATLVANAALAAR